MKTTEIIQIVVISSVLLGGIAVAVGKFTGSSSSAATADIKVPELSRLAGKGKVAYDTSCSSCHGENGAGSKAGPPLVHDTYNPGHHADEAFFRAAKNGVKQHHWPFGDMPPRPEVSQKEVANIIDYVRELQEANGIVYRAHRM
ncbi:c-type cytochrome [Sedimenticola hydrogenitrophicus]|uniref:c-type cytochrome n=1 Tax=Sedimenticola hydrogenitrophicus TaxID=2967975 RepID=UPI0021A8F2C5|nr:cytochrome c [Sedimenticola hydrogenitrophicus]